MIETILLLTLIVVFFLFVIVAFVRRKRINRQQFVLSMTVGLLIIISLFFFTGINKIKTDLSRLLENSSPKKAEEVYALLFKKPADGCLQVINFKDQLIPKIDCCIWMEVNLCPGELARIINSKKYSVSTFNRDDSVNFLAAFTDRPEWWSPQILGNELFKVNYRFDEDNEQTLFFSSDSSHVYLCDQAL